MKRPNFLFLISDQQRAADLGCYGHKTVKTPNIDKLAARGSRFDRFYCATPICMPNRATLMTGRMPSLHGVRHNGISLSTQAVTFVEMLREAGYRTAHIGKSHIQNMTDDEAMLQRHPMKDGYQSAPEHLAEAVKPVPSEGPYDQEASSRWQAGTNAQVALPFYGFDHVEFANDHADHTTGHHLQWQLERDPDVASLKGPQNAQPCNYTAPQAYRTAVPEELYSSTYITERTEDYLDDHVTNHADQPFFLFASFPDPHHPFTPPGKYWDMYDPTEVDLPSSFPRDGQPSNPLARWVYENRGPNAENRWGPAVAAMNEKEAREALALTYGMISMIDDKVGAIIAKLEKLGLTEDTVVIYSSDHGDFQAAHGLIFKGPMHVDNVVRVPFVWVDPTSDKPTSATQALGSTLDIAQTILDRAGVEPYNGIQGHSLVDIVSGSQEKCRDAVLIEESGQRTIFGFDGPVRARTAITDDWRITIYHNEEYAELFDLKNDPDEMKNLWDDPAYYETKLEMMEVLARLQLEHGDTSPLPDKLA
jgi:arylsulfatase A-like enzyme